MPLLRTLVLCSVLTTATTAALGTRTIHVFVALCDNANQGIVPVPATLGNGQDPARNLYWGAAYGVKTWFGKSTEWQRVPLADRASAPMLERVLFQHRITGTYLLADAYDGAAMRRCIRRFLDANAGRDTIHLGATGPDIHFGGGSDLVCFVGHDGLTDFALGADEVKAAVPQRRSSSMVLCCYSKRFFCPHITKVKGDFLLGTLGLMAPEAYVLHDALKTWIAGKDRNAVREAAAQAYHKYQKCGINAARKLFGAVAGP